MIDIFSIMPIEVFMDDRLSKTDIRVLGAILSYRNKNTNLCWPKREQIAERCNLPVCKISTATTHLVELGWLEKEGDGGRSRSTQYRLTVPDITVKTVTDLVTVTDSETVTDSVTKTVTDSVTKTVTDSVRGIKQTNKQTIEQTNKESIKDDDNLTIKQLMGFKPDQVADDLWESVLTARKKRKATQTKRAINGFINELQKCEQGGISMNDALDIFMQKTWRGIEAEWVLPKMPAYNPNQTAANGAYIDPRFLSYRRVGA